MYSLNGGLRKMSLVKCLKGLVSEQLATVNMLNSLKNCTTALSSYCFITLAKAKLENVRLSVPENLRVFVNTLSSAHVMCTLRNRKILRHSIQLQLSKKQKNFSQFLLDISYLHQMFNILKRKKR